MALVLLGAGAAGVTRFMPQPSLLDRAMKAVPQPEGSYQWLSDHELLCFHKPDGEQWDLFRLDVRTGGKTQLTDLTRLYDLHPTDPGQAEVSPDGKWLLWTTGDAEYAADLAGRRCIRLHQFFNAKDDWFICPPCWQADSRHLIQVTPGHDGLRADWAYVQNVEHPQEVRKLHITHVPEFESVQSYFNPPRVTPDGCIFTYASSEEWPIRTLVTLPLREHAIKSKIKVHAPPGMNFAAAPTPYGEAVARSTRGDRIAWICRSQPYTSPMLALLHRFIPSIAVHPMQWTAILVSRADGSEMHEIGGIQTQYAPFLSFYDTHDSPDLAMIRQDPPEIHDLRWLPGDQRLSFEYRGMLYTVPTD